MCVGNEKKRSAYTTTWTSFHAARPCPILPVADATETVGNDENIILTHMSTHARSSPLLLDALDGRWGV